MKPKELPENVSAMALAWALGVTTRQVRKLAATGVLRRVGHGLYPLAESIQAYAAWRAGEAERRDRATSTDAVREARTAEIRLRIAKEERKLIPIEDAEAEFEMVTGRFVAALEGLPARITRDVRERLRITAIIDEIRSRLSADFARAETAMVMGVHGDDKIDE